MRGLGSPERLPAKLAFLVMNSKYFGRFQSVIYSVAFKYTIPYRGKQINVSRYELDQKWENQN